MLKSIYIKNLAIIDDLNITFNEGLTIITGETGSGKSLIVKAIHLLLGNKFSNELLRTGENEIIVKGLFYYKNTNIFIERRYHKDGSTLNLINNKSISQRKIKEQVNLLINMHGQHDHQNLINSKTHIDYLDIYGSYKNDLDQLNNLYLEYENIKKAIFNKTLENKEINDQIELYEFQLKELDEYPLSLDFEKSLTDKYNILINANNINSLIDKITFEIDHDNNSILKSLQLVSNNIKQLNSIDSSFSDYEATIKSAIIDIEDLVRELNSKTVKSIVNDNEINILNDTISHIEMLKRKYGGTIESVIEYKKKIKTKINSKNLLSKEIKDLKVNEEAIKGELYKTCKYISKLRQNNSLSLEQNIKKHLSALDMDNVKFKIKINSDFKNISNKGIDICEFFISSNVGEQIKPVSKVSSGGEISRIMLAIKMAFQSKDIVDTLVFDEIDTGISGVTAENVGLAIEQLSLSHQILCITHLSQIASKGKIHYKVTKCSKNNRVFVNVENLSKKQRIVEIAQLISGNKLTNSSKYQAEELLQ